MEDIETELLYVENYISSYFVLTPKDSLFI
jgi:hypothetical protein